MVPNKTAHKACDISLIAACFEGCAWSHLAVQRAANDASAGYEAVQDGVIGPKAGKCWPKKY